MITGVNVEPFQFVWWWCDWWRPWIEFLGAWPHSPGVGKIIGSGKPFHGCIYRWRTRIWMLEVRRWA